MTLLTRHRRRIFSSLSRLIGLSVFRLMRVRVLDMATQESQLRHSGNEE